VFAGTLAGFSIASMLWLWLSCWWPVYPICSNLRKPNSREKTLAIFESFFGRFLAMFFRYYFLR